MTDIIRQPPEIIEVSVDESADAQIIGIDQDDIDTGGRLWSNLGVRYQDAIISSWMGREWRNLREFCSVNSLNYRSTREAFARRSVPTHAGYKRDRLENLAVEAASSALQFQRDSNALLVIQQQVLAQQLLDDPDMPIAKRLTIMNRLAGIAQVVGFGTSKVLEVAQEYESENVSGSETVVEATEVELPEEVIRSLRIRIAEVARQRVRQRDENLRGESNGQ